MKLRKIMLVAAFALSLTAVFASKARKQNFNAYFVDSGNPIVCDLTQEIDDRCSQFGTGAQCTVWDPAVSQLVPAYAAEDNINGGCMYPLYKPF